MPTYDYECQACGHQFEKFQPITATPVRKCPNCGKRKAKRLPGTGAGIIFKGEGFYQTDYRSSSYKKQAEKEKTSSKSENGSKPSKASDSSSSGSGAPEPAKKKEENRNSC